MSDSDVELIAPAVAIAVHAAVVAFALWQARRRVA